MVVGINIDIHIQVLPLHVLPCTFYITEFFVRGENCVIKVGTYASSCISIRTPRRCGAFHAVSNLDKGKIVVVAPLPSNSSARPDNICCAYL